MENNARTEEASCMDTYQRVDGVSSGPASHLFGADRRRVETIYYWLFDYLHPRANWQISIVSSSPKNRRSRTSRAPGLRMRPRSPLLPPMMDEFSRTMHEVVMSCAASLKISFLLFFIFIFIFYVP